MPILTVIKASTQIMSVILLTLILKVSLSNLSCFKGNRIDVNNREKSMTVSGKGVTEWSIEYATSLTWSSPFHHDDPQLNPEPNPMNSRAPIC